MSPNGDNLERNPRRRSVPTGLFDGIDFGLTGVGQGSAIPLMAVTHRPPPGLWERHGIDLNDADFGLSRYLYEAWDWIVRDIEEASSDSAEIRIPQNALTRFDTIGKNLLEDEAMEISSNGASASLTQGSRRVLLKAANARRRRGRGQDPSVRS